MIHDILHYTTRNHTKLTPEHMLRITWTNKIGKQSVVTLGPSCEQGIVEGFAFFLTLQEHQQ